MDDSNRCQSPAVNIMSPMHPFLSPMLHVPFHDPAFSEQNWRNRRGRTGSSAGTAELQPGLLPEPSSGTGHQSMPENGGSGKRGRWGISPHLGML